MIMLDCWAELLAKGILTKTASCPGSLLCWPRLSLMSNEAHARLHYVLVHHVAFVVILLVWRLTCAGRVARHLKMSTSKSHYRQQLRHLTDHFTSSARHRLSPLGGALRTMTLLPDDVWIEIFRYLESLDLVLSIRLVNRHLYHLSRAKHVWVERLADRRKSMLVPLCELDQPEAVGYGLTAERAILQTERLMTHWAGNGEFRPRTQILYQAEAVETTPGFAPTFVHVKESSFIFKLSLGFAPLAILDICTDETAKLGFRSVRGSLWSNLLGGGSRWEACQLSSSGEIVVVVKRQEDRYVTPRTTHLNLTLSVQPEVASLLDFPPKPTKRGATIFPVSAPDS